MAREILHRGTQKQRPCPSRTQSPSQRSLWNTSLSPLHPLSQSQPQCCSPPEPEPVTASEAGAWQSPDQSRSRLDSQMSNLRSTGPLRIQLSTVFLPLNALLTCWMTHPFLFFHTPLSPSSPLDSHTPLMPCSPLGPPTSLTPFSSSALPQATSPPE